MIEPCPYCGAEGYDNVIFLKDDPERLPRCGNCLKDVRTETLIALGLVEDEEPHD